jgi:hypothetical protein
MEGKSDETIVRHHELKSDLPKVQPVTLDFCDLGHGVRGGCPYARKG